MSFLMENGMSVCLLLARKMHPGLDSSQTILS